jgi:signal transduction histidine kinase
MGHATRVWRWFAGAGRRIPAVAVAIGVVTLVLDGSGRPLPWRVALVALAVAPWLASLARPVPPAALALTLVPCAVLFRGGDLFAALLVMLLLIELGAGGHRVAVVLAFAGALAIVVPPAVLAHRSDWVYWTGGFGISVFGGWSYNVQQRLEAQLHQSRSREALMEQRQRIARDVHDLVAHSLTVVLLHLTAARLALERDPREAAATLAETEGLGRQALTEVRRVVEVLRADDAREVEGTPPGVEDLPALVARLRGAGMAVDLHVEGDQGQLRPSTGLALYRVAQEALSNAARHAPGAPVEVRLRVLDGEARLSVRDRALAGAAAAADGGGHGVAGMRERVGLLGGTLRAGPADPGWVVECVIPAG